MEGTGGDLLKQCADAMREGADFPTVWNTLLKSHALVAGPPVQTTRGGHAQLEVFLVTGQRLIFDSASREFSLA